MTTLLRGRYEVLKKLGEGAFGETYQARDRERPSQPLCLVKRLKPVHTHQVVRAFFDREAKVLEKLGEHPQIPRLLAHFTIGQELFIVQEFVIGHSLRREIAPGKRMAEPQVIELLQDVLKTLVFVHRNGVVHRDIKPENVMRRQDGKLMLIDFGVVKELGSVFVTESGEIQTSVVAGTHGYMPIEQLRGKPGLYSDIYALGIMAIEALTGIYPTRLPDDPETGEILWRDCLRQSGNHPVKVSDRFAAVLQRMVEVFYPQRYPSALETLSDLQAILRSRTVPLRWAMPAAITAALPSTVSLGHSFASSLNPLSAAAALAPATPTASLWSRRQMLQNLGIAATSMVTVMMGGRMIERQKSNGLIHASSFQSFPLQTFRFETVTVDEYGSIVDHPQSQAQFFVEDLGNNVFLEMIEIPGGTFWMGSPEEEKERFTEESPQKRVRLPSFFMSKFPITQSQYMAIVKQNPSRFVGANRPVEMVSWHDAEVFCQALSQRTGRVYQLPSEAQWEYACRAGTTTPFHYGKTITTLLANYNGSESILGSEPTYHLETKGEYRQHTTEVGKFPPNLFGLYDMHGNVWEWCQDIWHDNYRGSPTDGSAWMMQGDMLRRVLRGGSWNASPRRCRSATRISNLPNTRDINNGFRVVFRPIGVNGAV
ncbi:bifunctional serine/threonine-protein kinase/formylglycine-generating enzyme family protein [Egbenema bharatensis]|uniref:bifunctional serine/threonine-protein kinase/formylglycine-generating enzyme family protein n=1 Tax=Egbenema bharatensis TaxID=3463334 RepID=UPI003A8C257C